MKKFTPSTVAEELTVEMLGDKYSYTHKELTKEEEIFFEKKFLKLQRSQDKVQKKLSKIEEKIINGEDITEDISKVDGDIKNIVELMKKESECEDDVEKMTITADKNLAIREYAEGVFSAFKIEKLEAEFGGKDGKKLIDKLVEMSVTDINNFRNFSRKEANEKRMGKLGM